VVLNSSKLTVPAYDLRFNHEISQLNESYDEAMERLHVSCLQLSSGTLLIPNAMAIPLPFQEALQVQSRIKAEQDLNEMAYQIIADPQDSRIFYENGLLHR
jgi:hypothetical protein